MVCYYNKYWWYVSFRERLKLFEDKDYKVIKYTDFKDWTRISTVRIWLDHWRTDDNEPVIFETMIFSKNKFLDCTAYRYTTLHDARIWHDKVVKMVSKHLSLKPKS